MIRWSLIEKDLISITKDRVLSKKCIYRINKGIAYRERNVLETYESMELEGNILHIYGENGYGFCVDFRKDMNTFGEICG